MVDQTRDTLKNVLKMNLNGVFELQATQKEEKPENYEREEGEIISDNEFSVSSEDVNMSEIIMRERIKELEAKNAEIEKIASISRCYGYDNSAGAYKSVPRKKNRLDLKNSTRGERLVTDASSLSSDESWGENHGLHYRKTHFINKKSNNSKKQRRKNNYSHRYHKRNRRRRISQVYTKKIKREETFETIVLDSENSLSQDELYRGLKGDNAQNRERLRIALSHNSNIHKTSGSLKERLLQDEKHINCGNAHRLSGQQISMQDKDSSLEEQELRLLALRSAVINKHRARKKRYAESAYSPTDFDNLLGNNLDICDNEDDICINNDLDDAHSTMDISPISSPKLLLSPVDSREENDDSMEQMVNTKPIDMEISNSDVENETASKENTCWKPIDENIYRVQLHSNCNELSTNLSLYNFQLTNLSKDCLSYKGNEDVLSIYNLNLTSEDNIKAAYYYPDYTISNPVCGDIKVNCTDLHSKGSADGISTRSTSGKKEDCTSSNEDEEEKALRALLLSKIRFQKKSFKSYENEDATKLLAADDSELRSDFVTNTNSIEPDDHTSILKDAVRRLKQQFEVHNDASEDVNIQLEEKTLSVENANAQAALLGDSVFVAVETTHQLPKTTSQHEAQGNSNNDGELCRNISKEAQNHGNVVKENELNEIQKSAANIYNINETEKSLSDEMCAKKSSVSTNLHCTNNIQRNLTKLNKENLYSTPPASVTAKDSNKPHIKPKVKQHLNQKKMFTRYKKIVKPNKVINTKLEVKSLETTISISDLDIPITKNERPSSPRLITANKLPVMPVKKLIITLRASDTDTSDNELDCHMNLNKFETINGTTLKGIEKYNEISSPLSLPMASPRDSPVRCHTPSELKESPNVADNKCFEQKLDVFLKSVRSKVETKSKTNTTSDKTSCLNNTAAAVRHLPIATQKEYRRLIHRMNMLEKRKQAKLESHSKPVISSKKPDITTHSAAPHETKLIAETVVDTGCENLIKPTEQLKCKEETELKKNSKNLPVKKNHDKGYILQCYEQLYKKTSFSILTNLNMTLDMVNQAKEVKAAKLQYEHSIAELRKQIDDFKQKINVQQQKMSTIIPSIRNSNELISNLKQKRKKLHRLATSLGEECNGKDYRLIDGVKKEIIQKSIRLAQEIRNVNSMQYESIEQFDANDKNSSNGKTVVSIGVSTECDFELNTSTNLTSNVLDLAQQTITSPVQCASGTERVNSRSNGEFHIYVKAEQIGQNVSQSNKEAEDVDAISKVSSLYTLSTDGNKRISMLREYVSPLEHIRHNSSHLDPNGVLCPYQFWGTCNDASCNNVHLQ